MKHELVKVELVFTASLLDRLYKHATSSAPFTVELMDEQDQIESDLGHEAVIQLIDQMNHHMKAAAA